MTLMKPKYNIEGYCTMGVAEWLLEKTLSMPINEVRDCEIRAITRCKFSLKKCGTSRRQEAVLHHERCNQDFSVRNYGASIGNTKYLTCPHCGERVKKEYDRYRVFLEFSLDTEFAVQYFGALLAFSRLTAEKKYYVVNDTRIVPDSFLNIGEMNLRVKRNVPETVYCENNYEVRVQYPIRYFVRPAHLTREYILNALSVIEEATKEKCLLYENECSLLLQDALSKSYIIDEEAYAQIAPIKTSNEILVNNIRDILNVKTQEQFAKIGVHTKTAEPAFKTYYFHNIPVSEMKKLSGVTDISGVYILRDQNGRYYVGQGVHCIKRCLSHFIGTPKDEIGYAYKMGVEFLIEDFITGVEGQDFIHLDTLEAMCIQKYKAKELGYNKTAGNHSNNVVNRAFQENVARIHTPLNT